MHAERYSNLRVLSMEVPLSNVPFVAGNLTVGVLGIRNFNVLVPNLELLHRINPILNRLSIIFEYFAVVILCTVSFFVFFIISRVVLLAFKWILLIALILTIDSYNEHLGRDNLAFWLVATRVVLKFIRAVEHIIVIVKRRIHKL